MSGDSSRCHATPSSTVATASGSRWETSEQRTTPARPPAAQGELAADSQSLRRQLPTLDAVERRRRRLWGVAAVLLLAAAAIILLLLLVPDAAAALPDSTLLVHCASGFRASIAASLLARAGRRVVLVDDDVDRAAAAGLSWVA